jgi:hypothetical protein
MSSARKVVWGSEVSLSYDLYDEDASSRVIPTDVMRIEGRNPGSKAADDVAIEKTSAYTVTPVRTALARDFARMSAESGDPDECALAARLAGKFVLESGEVPRSLAQRRQDLLQRVNKQRQKEEDIAVERAKEDAKVKNDRH